MQNRNHWKIKKVVMAFGYAGVLYVAAFVPGLNAVLYSGHGIGWTALLVSLPIAVIIMLFD